MAFREAFISLVPDAQPERHNCKLSTAKSEINVVMVKDKKQAFDVIEKLI